MAYVSQELKAKLAPRIKEICKRYGVKATLSVHNHSKLTLNVRQGDIDFLGNYNQHAINRQSGIGTIHQAIGYLDVNPYWYHEHFTGKAKAFLDEVIPALKGPDYFDHSDAMVDYFHCSHYYGVSIGKWDKPYALVK